MNAVASKPVRRVQKSTFFAAITANSRLWGCISYCEHHIEVKLRHHTSAYSYSNNWYKCDIFVFPFSRHFVLCELCTYLEIRSYIHTLWLGSRLTLLFCSIGVSVVRWSTKMLIVAVVILSFISLSPAQPTDPHPQCTGAFDAVFNPQTTCAEAYDTVFYGNATDEQQMMVCNADQQCNSMIESIISACGNMVSLYT